MNSLFLRRRDQVVSVCATNYSGTVHDMLLAIVDATAGSNAPGSVLVAQPTQLAPGRRPASLCRVSLRNNASRRARARDPASQRNARRDRR